MGLLALSLAAMLATFWVRGRGCTLKFMNTSLLDGWSLSHVVVFAALAAIVPEYWWVVFAVGFAWELLEYCLEKMRVPNVRFKLLDLVYNLLGIGVGLLAASRG